MIKNFLVKEIRTLPVLPYIDDLKLCMPIARSNKLADNLPPHTEATTTGRYPCVVSKLQSCHTHHPSTTSPVKGESLPTACNEDHNLPINHLRRCARGS